MVAGLLVAPGFVNWNSYKDKITSQVKTVTGYDMDLAGDISLHILPYPAVSIADVTVKNGGSILAKLGKLNASVALFPLLSGAVQVNTVSLVDPMITLSTGPDGRGNWVSPEIEALSAKDTAGDGEPSLEKDKSKKAQVVSIQNLKIENGVFSFAGAGAKGPLQIQDINITMGADSLSGPFELDGHLNVAGQDIKMTAKTGTLDPEQPTVSLNADVVAHGAKAVFKGIVALKEPYVLQGETSVDVSSLGKTLSSFKVNAPVSDARLYLEGVLTASQTKFEYKNLKFDLGDTRFTGEVDVALSPAVKGGFLLEAGEPINLDHVLKMTSSSQNSVGGGSVSAGGEDSSGQALSHPGAFLPPTINIPADTTLTGKIDIPTMIYDGQTYQGVGVGLDVKDGGIVSSLHVAAIPGNGKVSLSAGLKGPKTVMAFAVSGTTNNVSQTLAALGAQNVSLPDALKTGGLDVKGQLTPSHLTIAESALFVGDTKAQFSGGLAVADNGRLRLNLKTNVPTLNVDTFAGDASATSSGAASEPSSSGHGKSSGTAGANLKKTMAGVQLPVDVSLDARVGTLVLNGQTAEGVQAKGALVGNALNLDTVSVTNIGGLSGAVKGKIGDVRGLSDMALNVVASTQDASATVKALGMSNVSVPKSVKAVQVKTDIAGTLDAMRVDTVIEALGAKIGAKGALKAPLDGVDLSDGLDVSLYHSNFSQFLNTLSPGGTRYTSWEKPLDISGTLRQAGQRYSINNVKGSLAGTSVSGQLAVDVSGKKPNVEGRLSMGDLVVQTAEWNAQPKTSSTVNIPAAPSAKSKPRWSKADIDTVWMDSLDMALVVDMNSLAYQSWLLSKPLLDINLKKGTLGINKLGAGLYGGTADISGQIKSSAGPLSMSVKVGLQNINLEPLVGSMVGTKLIKGKGVVNFDTALTGSGRSAHDLVTGLAGQGAVTGQNILLEGMDLTRFARALSEESKPGDSLLNLWKGTTGQGSTAFDTLDGAFVMNKGVARLEKLDLDGPKASITTKGDVDLPDWRVRTAHTITLKDRDDIPPFTINIDGPLDNPAQTFGRGAINDYLSRKIGRKLNKLIDDGTLGEKLNEKLGGDLGNALGSILGVPAQNKTTTGTTPAASDGGGAENTAPANDNQVPSDSSNIQPSQPPAQITPEDALKDVIKGLF